MATKLAISTSDEACERMDVTILGDKQMLCHEDIAEAADVRGLSLSLVC